MMEMMVPRPRHWPMPTMQASEVIWPMRMPDTVMMVPEVRMVGNAKLMVSIMACLCSILSFSSLKRVAMTIA